MNKDNAARFVNCSVRTLQRNTELLRPDYLEGKTGDVADYAEDRLREFARLKKLEINEDFSDAARAAASANEEQPSTLSTALATITRAGRKKNIAAVAASQSSDELTTNKTTTLEKRKTGALATIPPNEKLAARFQKTIARGMVRTALKDKLVLDLTEAAVCSGLSSASIKNAIKAGVLTGRIIGGGYKVRPHDLNEFVALIFQ